MASPNGQLIARDAILLACGIVTPIACAFAAFRTLHHERAGWLFMGVGTAMMLSGDIFAVVLGGTPGPPHAPNSLLPAAIWIAAYPAYFAAVTRFLELPHVRGIERIRHGVDLTLIVLITALSVFSSAVFPHYGVGTVTRPFAPSLILFATLIFSTSLFIFVLSRQPRLRPWHGFLVVGLLGTVVGAFLELAVHFTWTDSASSDVWISLPWFLGYVAVMLAALIRAQTPQPERRTYVVQLGEISVGFGVSATAVVFMTLPFFSYLARNWTSSNAGGEVLAGLCLITALTAVGRNLAVAVENTSLRRRSSTDPLTGLYNHRHFQERLSVEVQRAERDDESISVAMIDVDDFDRVNNIHGHAAGDQRLCAIGEALKSGARSSDLVCRVGGDEFALIMSDTDAFEAYRVCLRLQDALRGCDPGCPQPVSVSIGIASMPEHAMKREQLVQRADGALYWAKFHGREHVVIFDPDLVRTLGPEERIAMLEEEAYLKMVQLLASAVDARDPYTQRHSRNVANLCVGFAHTIGLDARRLGRLETAALLHDVGKIGVADAILGKTQALTTEEYAKIKEHPELAARILSAIPRQEILPWIASHHECWDGSGYPEGLAGTKIPYEARIIALCDAYDAMTSDRPYRKGLDPDHARDQILACAGTQFDPGLANKFASFIEQWAAPVEHDEALATAAPAERRRRDA